MMLLLLLATATSAALPEGPLDFDAEEMSIAPHQHRVLLDGAVHLRRSDLVVTGDHAIVEYAAGGPSPSPRKHQGAKKSLAALGGQSLQRFTMQGKVHVERGRRTADGAQGVLDVPAQTMVLTGTPEAPPVLRDGKETLSGERVLLHLDSEDIEVVRPRLVLHRSLSTAAVDGSSAQDEPVRVEAANLKLNRESRLARFTSDVVLRRGDATVRSPLMDARSDPDGQLTRLELRGGVDLRQGDRRATGQNADYDARTRAVVLTGEPRLYDRGDVLAGERINLSLDSKEVRVERARGRFRPEAHKDELERRP